MPNYPTPDDSPWNDLAAELGLDSTPATPVVPPPAHEPAHVDLEDEDASASHDDTVVIPALHDEAVAEDGEGEEGDAANQPDKKRRRRRRRRRKGGADATSETTAEDAAEADGETETEADGEPEVEVEAEGEVDADESYDEEPAEDETPDGVNVAADKEVIANWNVPAWEEIVAGLYRPER